MKIFAGLLIAFSLIVYCSVGFAGASSQVEQLYSKIHVSEQRIAVLDKLKDAASRDLLAANEQLGFAVADENMAREVYEKAASEFSNATQSHYSDQSAVSQLLKQKNGAWQKYLVAQQVSDSAQNKTVAFEKQLRDETAEISRLAVEINNSRADIFDIEFKQPVWIDGYGEAIMTRSTTHEQCENIAIQTARRDALEKAGGVFINSVTVISNNAVTKDEIRSQVNALILQQDTSGSYGKPQFQSNGDFGKYSVKVRLLVQNTSDYNPYRMSIIAGQFANSQGAKFPGYDSETGAGIANLNNAANSLSAIYVNKYKNMGPEVLKNIQLGYSFSPGGLDNFSAQLMQPITSFSEGTRNLVFTQLRYNYNAGIQAQQVANAGLGYRFYSPESQFIFGINAFYDYGSYSLNNVAFAPAVSSYNQSRVGAGLEFFAGRFENRLNVYYGLANPVYLGGNCNFNYYERVVNGADFETGFSIPKLPFWNIYANGSYFDYQYTDTNKFSCGVRTTIQLFPQLRAEYGYDVVNKTQYAGVYLNLFGTIDAALFGSDAINEIAEQNIANKLLLPVQRNNNITVERYSVGIGGAMVTVFKPDGTLAAGVVVNCVQGGTVVGSEITGSNGVASFSRIETGNYYFSAEINGNILKSDIVNITAGSTATVIIASGSAAIKLLDSHDLPAANVAVNVFQNGNLVKTAFSDKDGVLAIALVSGSYMVSAVIDEIAVSASLVVETGKACGVVLQPGVVEIQKKDSYGYAASYFEVTIFENGNVVKQFTADYQSGGKVALPPGTYSISTNGSYPYHSVITVNDVVVKAGQKSVAVLQPGLAIVFAFKANGEPASYSTRVFCLYDGSEVMSNYTYSGSCNFDNLTAGNYRFYAVIDGQTVYSDVVAVYNGGINTNITLRAK